MKTIVTSGKRKTAVARAAFRKGAGRVRINSVPLEIWEPMLAREKVREPLVMAGDKAEKIDINVTVHGGGVMGQADAIRTAVARGLVQFFSDDALRQLYVAYDRTLLVNDTRRKETKHPLGRGARKKWQKSYR